MCQHLVETLQRVGYQVVLIEKAFSRRQADIGKPQLRKLLRALYVILRLGWLRLKMRPGMAIIFVPVARWALLVDMAIIEWLRFLQIPSVLYFHGKGYRSLAQSSRLWARLLERSFSRVRGGMVLGERLKEDVESFVPPEHLVVVPNMVPWTDVAETDDSNRRKVQVLFLANLQPGKGAMAFLDAAKEVARCTKDVDFVLAGPARDPEYEARLRAVTEQKGLLGRVSMPGGVYGNQKERLFCNSDVFVFPTRYKQETFGIVNVEAMRAGLPVISSPEGAIPEVVLHGITGYVVDPSDSSRIAEHILELVRNPSLRAKMGEAARSRYEQKYSPDAYAISIQKAMESFTQPSLEKVSSRNVS